MRAEPAVAAVPPRPFGELSRTPAASIAGLARDAWETPAGTARHRYYATGQLLEYLEEFPGHTWQARWDASPLGRGEAAALDIGRARSSAENATPWTAAVRALFCLRVVQPSLLAFRRNSRTEYSPFFVTAQRDPALEHYAELTRAADIGHLHRRDALFCVCSLLTCQGIAFADITPASLLHHGHEYRRVKNVLRAGRKDRNRFDGYTAWTILHKAGHFPAGTPGTMREALHRGPLTATELVSQYQVENASVRELLIAYLQRRSADADYSTLSGLAVTLVKNFWLQIEELSPGHPDLKISPELYDAWRERISVRADGKPRKGLVTELISVRSFYYDLHTWAVDEPELWGPWVAPNPIPPRELRGMGKLRRRSDERTADRIRERQPLLPILMQHVTERYEHYRDLRELTAHAAVDEEFTHRGRTFRREVTAPDRHRGIRNAPSLRVRDLETGELIAISFEEDSAFWDWAVTETLRHSGLRVEELGELSHLSIRRYQRANGEVIGLLVVAPSKTDRERVIPMSPDLFHIIACIVRRHTADGKTIPLLAKFDPHDKVWSADLPYLFQRLNGGTRSVISSGTILNMLKRRCEALATEHPAFRTIRFTPHDFRRLFATELVNSGLPIHIGAALLGHLNIQTTRGYVAVFDEDVVRHYTAYLSDRRQVRPSEEYRPVTDDEWTEFEEHFDKRKVELGACARPYGTPCIHEHACVRCPMLHVSTKMLARLDDLEVDLLARRQRAESEGWLGEIEGVELTLSHLRTKQEETRRRAQRPLVDLGIPILRTPGE
ncbi:site-specific integrase [Yinghuangia sp. KLBMP8922]|uniref:Site-specific integrase n=2 Tax=Yinghuangia soli TaxID=2908204 RepID=A0AA41PVR6_9ACTN|nr:site-specific integrase [Yinghuangia soli]